MFHVKHQGVSSDTGGSVSSRNVNLFTRERELKELTEKLSAGQDELERLLKQMQDGQKRKDGLKERSAGALEELHQQVLADADQRKGEFVLVVEGAGDDADAVLAEGLRVYSLLSAHLPPSKAAKLAAELTGAPRKLLYARSSQGP